MIPKFIAIWMCAMLVLSSAVVMLGNEAKAEDNAVKQQSVPGESILANGTFGGGDGSIGNPYVIEDVYDLQAVIPNKHFILGNDIDATETATWNAGAGFIPIGAPGYFYGTLDGAGYVIYNLTINSATADYVGLFMTIYDSAKVSNLTMVNCNIVGSYITSYAGMLAANNWGTVTNCGVSGSVYGEMRTGGLVAYNEGTITGSYSSGTVTCPDSPAGGFVADNFGTISNCYSTSDVLTGLNVGGFVSLNGGTIANCYSTGNALGVWGYGGGFAAENYNMITGTITNCYSTGAATGAWGVGGFLGHYDSGAITGCFWDTQTSGIAVAIGSGTTTGMTGRTTTQMKTQSTFTGAGWTFGTTPGSATWFMIPVETRPFLQAEYSTMIYTSHQVQLIKMDLNANYALACSVDMSDITVPRQMWGTSVASGAGFEPIGKAGAGIWFTGSLDGQNHTITNLYVKRPTTNYVGLFGYFNTGAIVANIGLVNAQIWGNENTGGLIGANIRGFAINSFTMGNIVGASQYTGGLVGYNIDGLISDSFSSAYVDGAHIAGGLVGYNQGTGVIQRSHATGNVDGTSSLGGLVGTNWQASVNTSYATGNVVGTTNNIGGLVGYSSSGSIDDSYATGDATTVTTLSGQMVGGLVGYNNLAWINNTYATGIPTGGANLGGLVGSNDAGWVTVSYWDTTTSGTMTGISSGTTTGATGRTTAQMKLQATFAGWDFASVWSIKETYTYPFHIWNWFNSAPIAEDDDFTTTEGSVLTGGNVTEDNGHGPDFDIDMHPLTVVELNGDSGAIGVPTTIGSGAIVTLNWNGTFVYDPNGSFEFLAPGSWEIDEFDYTIYDNNGSYDEATVFVNVTGLDDAPIAFGDSYTTAEDTPLNVNAAAGVLANDFDDDGDPTVALKLTDPATGTLFMNSNGSFLYTSPADWFGTVNFTYKANDGTTDSNIATVFINVTSVNDLPDGADNTVTVDEDLDYTFAPADFGFTDSDVGDTLSAIRITTLESAGDLELNGVDVSLNQIITVAAISSNLLSFTPAINANGIGYANFGFSVRDSQNGFDPVPNNMTINVNAVNDAPSAISDFYSTVEDITLTVTAPGVLGNDFDIENDTLTAVLDTDVSHGTLTLNADGSFEYIPTTGYIGSDSFTYHANDGGADSNIVTVSINVTAANTAPILDPIGNMTINEMEFFQYHPTATDAENDTLTFSLIAAGANATFSAGNLTWTPGEDQGPGTYSYTIQVSDGSFTDSETFWITVAEVNRAPVLDAIGNQTVGEETLLTFTATATDADLPANILTYSLGSGMPAGAVINATTGVFTWTPTEAQGPGLYDIAIIVTDNGTPNLDDTEVIFVTVTEGNIAPVLGAIGAQAINEETLLTFTATATDADLPANTLTFSLDAGYPAGAGMTAGGVFTWTPTEGQGPGFYNITARVSDGTLEDSETFMVTVGEVNLVPVLGGIGNRIVDEGTPITFTATATDADLPANTLTYSLDPGFPTGAEINATTGAFSWTPTEAQGPEFYNITVRVSDGSLEDFEMFMITVNEVNLVPVLGAIGPMAVNEGAALTFTATATDPDLPANTLTYSLDPGFPAGAAINFNTGAFTWTPTEAQGQGVYSITIRVSDGTAEDFETISVTVNEINVAPVLGALSDRTVDELTLLTFTATANDADLPANVLIFSLEAGAPVGAAITAGGVFTWTPTEAQGPGIYSITVRVTDANGMFDNGTFTVTVNEVNSPPVANDDFFVIYEDSGWNSIDVLANDYDQDGDVLQIVQIICNYGVVSQTQSGLVYQPSSSFYGTITFTYGIMDKEMEEDQATVTIRILNVNDPPRVVDDSFTMDEDDPPMAMYILANDDSHPDPPETLTVTSVMGGAHGTVVIAPSGTHVIYWPKADYNGFDSFSYTVSDGNGGTAKGSVFVTINPVNDAPVITSADVTDLMEGDEYSVRYTATDIDGDTLEWSIYFPLGPAAEWLTINPSTGLLNGTAEIGYFGVLVMVTDGNGGSDSRYLRLRVLQRDSDGDSVPDDQDAFPNNANETVDTDDNGIGNNADPDDDGDGVPDTEDAFPLNPAESLDTDGDGIGNNSDPDMDGDGVPNEEDSEPLNAAITGNEYNPGWPYWSLLMVIAIMFMIGLASLAIFRFLIGRP